MEDVYRTGLFKYAPKSTASGESILLENSAPEPFVDMKPYGHSWQNETPTPSNPIPFESAKEVKVLGGNIEQTLTLPALREGDYISYDDRKLTRCSGEYVFTGEEDFDDLIESYDAITTRFPHKSASPFLCTHVITDDTSGSYWANDNNLAFCASAFGVTSVEDFKNFLREEYNSDTPCKIVYQLAEPIETDLTDEQIYAFKRLRANNPTTTIVGQGQVDVTYIVDNRQ
jgi:hypothetical protein